MAEEGRARIFLASRNTGKIAEMERILSAYMPGVQVVGLDDVPDYPEPVENEPTFAGNALLKAHAGVRNTGLPSIADDSGLCVEALNGMPGVLSARWAGVTPKSDAANNALLLAQMSDIRDEHRGARFRCAIAFCTPGGKELVVHGEMVGRIIRETRGAGGFGYDVLFVADEHAAADDGAGLTSAQLTPAEKDAISHRGRALREIAPLIAERLA